MLSKEASRAGLAILGSLFLLVGSVAAGDGQSITWIDDIDAAKEQAQELDRPMLIFVTMQGCRYCDQMKATTLKDDEVVQELNEGYVATYLDESQNRELVRSLGIRSFPTTLIATPDGRVREMVRGFVGAGKLRDRLQARRDDR